MSHPAENSVCSRAGSRQSLLLDQSKQLFVLLDARAVLGAFATGRSSAPISGMLQKLYRSNWQATWLSDGFISGPGRVLRTFLPEDLNEQRDLAVGRLAEHCILPHCFLSCCASVCFLLKTLVINLFPRIVSQEALPCNERLGSRCPLESVLTFWTRIVFCWVAFTLVPGGSFMGTARRTLLRVSSVAVCKKKTREQSSVSVIHPREQQTEDAWRQLQVEGWREKSKSSQKNRSKHRNNGTPAGVIVALSQRVAGVTLRKDSIKA